MIVDESTGDTIRLLLMPLQPGTRLGAYEIQALLGTGGMGEVYRARDTRLGRDVAIKVLPETLWRDAERSARFEREARLLASLNHPHIGAIYGFEETGALRGLVLELIHGPTLAERIAARPLAVAEALSIARQMADALESAHDRGIIHRDLEPANIKLTSSGEVKVLDFGLAKAMAGDRATPDLSHAPTITSDGTRAGAVLGTPAYMSPEQARSQPVDKRTDVWAFGCVLYEMLTGRRAFAGKTTPDTISAVLGVDPDWQALPEATPAAVRRLLQRCLQKDPKRRLHDIADARIELEDIGASDADVRVGTTPPRTRARAGIMAWTVGVAAVGVLATLWVTSRSQSRPVALSPTLETTVTQLTNYGGNDTSGVISPDGKTFAFVSAHGGTPDIWLRQVSGGEPIRLTNDGADETNLEYAPDGESIFFTVADAPEPSLWRIRALGGQPQKVLSNARLFALSPDGRRVAYYRNEAGGVNVLVVSALDGTASRALVQDRRPGNAVRPAWSPDGRQVGYVQTALLGPSNLFVVDVATARLRQVTRALHGIEGVQSFAWLPDNQHVVVAWIGASAFFNSDLAIVDVRDGAMTRLTMNVDGAFRTLHTSADGSRLIATAVRIRRELWKVPFGPDPDENGRAAIRLLDSTHDPMWTFVSRDGGTLLFNSPIGGRNLWTMPLDRHAIPRQITSIAGNGVAQTNQRGLKLIDVERQAVLWEDQRSGTGLSLPMFSADGQRISAPYQESRDRDAIWVFDALTGKSRLAVRFSTPFRIYFRASWVDNDQAFIVNRYETISNVVLFDRFWARGSAKGR